MNELQSKEKIIKLAEELDNNLELQQIDKILPYFDEKCEIEIFGLHLKGKHNLRKWLNWFFNLFDTIKFEPIVIIVENNIFFEEFVIYVTFNQGKELSIKVAEVLEYQNYKIKSLRLYLDRLEFANNIATGFFSKKILGIIKQKSLKGLI